jgi:hypothetical protein
MLWCMLPIHNGFGLRETPLRRGFDFYELSGSNALIARTMFLNCYSSSVRILRINRLLLMSRSCERTTTELPFSPSSKKK